MHFLTLLTLVTVKLGDGNAKLAGWFLDDTYERNSDWEAASANSIFVPSRQYNFLKKVFMTKVRGNCFLASYPCYGYGLLLIVNL